MRPVPTATRGCDDRGGGLGDGSDGIGDGEEGDDCQQHPEEGLVVGGRRRCGWGDDFERGGWGGWRGVGVGTVDGDGVFAEGEADAGGTILAGAGVVGLQRAAEFVDFDADDGFAFGVEVRTAAEGVDGDGEFLGGLLAAKVELAEVAKDETLVGLAAQHCFQQVVQFCRELGLWINAILCDAHSNN